MKFQIAYYALLLYAIAAFKPLVQMAVDGWSHVFAEADHINRIHLKYGSNHLEKELANTGSDNGSKDQNTVKSEEASQWHLVVTECKSEPVFPEKEKNYSSFLLPELSLIC